jgi:hypothetical protein
MNWFPPCAFQFCHGCWYEGHSESNASSLFPWKLRYSVSTIVSNALKLIFSYVHSFVFVNHRFAWMSWSKRSTFRDVTALHGHLERGLSFTCLSPLLKRATHCLTVLTSTVWSLSTFSKHRWIWLGAIFFTWRNLITHLCFILISISDAIMSDCPSAIICCMATKFNGILAGR